MSTGSNPKRRSMARRAKKAQDQHWAEFKDGVGCGSPDDPHGISVAAVPHRDPTQPAVAAIPEVSHVPAQPDWLVQALKAVVPPGSAVADTKVIAGYVRYSTTRQREDSSERQKSNIMIYVQRSWPGAIVIFFMDLERSGGTTEDRPELEKMMKQAEDGRFFAVVLEDADRISRKFTDMAAIYGRLQKAGVELHSAYHGKALDTRDVAHLGASADEDRERFLKRSQQAREAQAAAGRSPTGPCYAYAKALNPAGRKDQAIDREKAEIVRRIFRLALAGMSTHAIADLLNGEGIPAPKGGKWRGMTVHVILTNARYAGWIIYNRFTRRKNAHGVWKDVENPATKWVVSYRADLAIVDAETFARVAEILRNRAPAEAKRFEQSKYALSRRMECHACGSVMQIRISNGYRFAACGKRLDHKACTNGEMVGLARIEGAVLGAVCDQLEGPALQAVADGYNDERQRRQDVSANRRAGLARTAEDMERKLRASLEAGYSLGVSHDVVVSQRTEWSERRAEALRELAELEAQCEPVALDADRVAGLLARLRAIVPGTPFRPEDLEGRELIAVFRELVDKVIVLPRMSDGSVPLAIHGRVADAVLDMESPAVGDQVLRAVCAPVPYERRLTQAAIEAHARNGAYRFSDREMHIVWPYARDSERRRSDDAPTLSDVLQYIRFVCRTRIAWETPPSALGNGRKLLNAAKRLVYSGTWDRMVEALRRLSPDSLDGIDLERVANIQKDRATGIVALTPLPASTPDAEIVEAVARALERHGRPMVRADLRRRLEAEGFVLGGGPQRFGQILTRSPRLVGLKRYGIWLADRPLPRASATSGPPSAA